MRKTIIVSDLTGAEFAADADVSPVKITANGKSGSRDLTPDEISALTAWVTADAESLPAARDALRALLAPAPAPAASKPRKSASGSKSKGADPRNAAIREWAGTPEGRAALGLAADAEISPRGRLPKEFAEKYDAAHPAAA